MPKPRIDEAPFLIWDARARSFASGDDASATPPPLPFGNGLHKKFPLRNNVRARLSSHETSPSPPPPPSSNTRTASAA